MCSSYRYFSERIRRKDSGAGGGGGGGGALKSKICLDNEDKGAGEGRESHQKLLGRIV